MRSQDENFLSKFTPKQSFIGGIIVTILALGTLGFVYMLSKQSVGDVGQSADSNRVAGAPTVPPPPPSGGGSAENIRPVSDEDHVKGPKNAKITVVEFSDLECPFCKRFHPTMQQLLADNKDVNWVYRHFPLDSLHRKARAEAEATECAAEQGKFWELTDKIFEVTPSNDGLDLSTLPDLAKQAGVKDIKKFQECMDSGKYASHVSDDLRDAQASGGTGTPFSVVIVGDQKIPVSGAVPLGQLQSIIDSFR